MNAEERALRLTETFLSDMHKADVDTCVRWLGANARKELSQAEAAARAEEGKKRTESCERYTAKCIEQERTTCAKIASRACNYNHGSDSLDYHDGWRQGALHAAKTIRARND